MRSGIDIATGDTIENETANDADDVNDRIDTMETSLETAFTKVTAAQELVTNDSGGALAAGDYVYFSGYDATNTQPKVKKAVVTESPTTSLYADAVVKTGGVDQATDIEVVQRQDLTAQNTSGLTAGRPIFLATTEGDWTGTIPAPSNRVQIVGKVLEVNATTGVIRQEPGAPLDLGSAGNV